jgi:hypothetical protein
MCRDLLYLRTPGGTRVSGDITGGWSQMTLVEKTSGSVSQNKALYRDTGCKQQDSFIERKMYRQEEIPQDRVVGSDQMTQNS